MRVLRLLKQFRSLGPEYQRREFLETAAASVFVEALPRAINTYTTYKSMEKALERAGTLSRQTERKQLLIEYGELLGFLNAAKDGADPWLEINHFARNALERTWGWLVTLREGNFPGELLPFDFIHKMIALKKSDWPKLNREAKSSSLRQFGRRDGDGLTILLNGRTVQVAKVFNKLQADDLPKIVEWKSGFLDAVDKRLFRQGKALLRASKEGKLVEAQPLWELWESWKTYKAPESQTLIRVPPWLSEDRFIAHVAKGLAKILEIVGTVPIDILEPAWARVLGTDCVNTVPRPYDPFPKIRKVAPDLDKLCPEWYKTTKIFRRQEMANYCAIIGCAHGPVGYFNICSAHLATLADMLEQGYDVSPTRAVPCKIRENLAKHGKTKADEFLLPIRAGAGHQGRPGPPQSTERSDRSTGSASHGANANVQMSWAIAKKLSDHSRLARTSVGSHPCDDLDLPDMFFMARSGRHCKAWRPVSFGNSGPLVLEPENWAQKQELDFFALFVLSTKFEAGLTVENLLGPVSESLETHTYILRDALRKRTERGVAILAFILELNDLALLDKLEISGGQASFCPQGSVKMEMPVRSWGRLKSGNWSQAYKGCKVCFHSEECLRCSLTNTLLDS